MPKNATLTLVHTHATEPAEVAMRLKPGGASRVRHTVLTHDVLNAHNTFAHPGTVLPTASPSQPRVAGEKSAASCRLAQ